MRIPLNYALAAILPLAAACTCLAAPVAFTPIYSLGSGPDSPMPVWQAALLSDGSGGFYGVANPGTVFHLTPPAARRERVPSEDWSWTRRATSTERRWVTPTAVCPTGCGLVFQLTPPGVAGGDWTENVLHSFTGYRRRNSQRPSDDRP
jgi:hypothetical protein